MDQGDHNQHGVTGDTPCHRTTVAEMSDVELTDWVAGIRRRRMLMQHEYEKAREAKETAKREKDRKELAQQVKMLDKEMEQLDKLVVKVEKRIEKVRAIRVLAERMAA